MSRSSNRFLAPMIRSLALLGACSLAALAAPLAPTPTLKPHGLGTGNALDANTGVGTGGQNTPGSLPDYRSRNLLITGDVVGGRGFRGSVGYAAAGDFTGHLGSNDTYQFRARSAGTGVPYFDVARTVDPLRFGQDMGLMEYHRSGYTAPVNPANDQLPTQPRSSLSLDMRSSPAVQAPPDITSYKEAQMRLDQILSATSSSSQGVIGTAPNFVGQVYSPDGKVMATDASSLRGLRYMPQDWVTQSYGMSTYDMVRTLDDLTSGRTKETAMGRPFDSRFVSTLEDQRIKPLGEPQPESGAIDARVNPQQSPDYSKVLEKIADRYAQTDNVKIDAEPRVLRQLDDDFKALREQLKVGGSSAKPTQPEDEPGFPSTTDDPRAKPATPPSGSDSGAASPTPPGTATFLKPQAQQITDPRQPTTAKLTTARERLEDLRRRQGDRDPIMVLPSPIDVRDFGAILRHGEQVEHMSGADSTRLNELMAAAEEKMKTGEYFMAERRFTRALRYTPGHPLAVAGIINSQIGAGLYLSAAFTFSTLAAHSPEMIDVRYAPDLLPRPEHLDKAADLMRKKIADAKTTNEDRASFGLILAYIGHQIRNRDMISEGLQTIARSTPDDALLPLLDAVWLGTDDPAQQQPPAPATPATPDK